jgi:hypothetical protein
MKINWKGFPTKNLSRFCPYLSDVPNTARLEVFPAMSVHITVSLVVTIVLEGYA